MWPSGSDPMGPMLGAMLRFADEKSMGVILFKMLGDKSAIMRLQRG